MLPGKHNVTIDHAKRVILDKIKISNTLYILDKAYSSKGRSIRVLVVNQSNMIQDITPQVAQVLELKYSNANGCLVLKEKFNAKEVLINSLSMALYGQTRFINILEV